MNGVEVLVLHGPPGSGKTTLSRAMAELLRAAERPHAVIDLDDLSKIYPDRGRSFACDNLKAIWPNYATVPQLKVVIPSVIADEHEREQLRAAVPGARFVVCELTAPEAILKKRVTAREPNENWQRRLHDRRSVPPAKRPDSHQGLPSRDTPSVGGRDGQGSRREGWLELRSVLQT